MSLAYRPEIDGLRAVAVSLVLLFHAGFSSLRGGYIGVDVFFVISGFLITNIIVREVETNSFDLGYFFWRRARRVLPVLFFVILCIALFALFILDEKSKEDLQREIIAAAALHANFYFAGTSDYFNDAAKYSPLIHTWSLAVEEQFYIIYPLFFLLARRLYVTNTRRLIIIVASLSFGLTFYYAYADSALNYFSTFTRAWELMLGAIAAFVPIKRAYSHQQQLLHSVLANFGLLTIIICAVIFDQNIPFPSYLTLVPCFGAVFFILHAREDQFITRLLSSKIFVAIGVLSYGLYLWHQPIFAFSRYLNTGELNFAFSILILGVCFLLAQLTYTFIEVPAKKIQPEMFKQKMSWFWASIVASFSLVTFLALSAEQVGVPSRVAQSSDIETRLRPNRGLANDCWRVEIINRRCQTKDDSNTLLWGDSFAMHLAQMIKPHLESGMIQRTMSNCAPLADVAKVYNGVSPMRAKKCLDFNERVLREILSNGAIENVILSAQWASYVDADSKFVSTDTAIDNDRYVVQRALERLVEKIASQGKGVFIVFPPPSPGFDVGRCFRRIATIGGEIRDCDFPKYKSDKRLRFVAELENRIKSRVEIFSMDSILCDGTTCPSSIDGVFIYRDSGHLSVEGSEYLSKLPEVSSFFSTLGGRK